MTLFDDVTQQVIATLRTWVRARWRQGCVCPVCDQSVKLYKRNLNRGMASLLLEIFKAARAQDAEYLHVSRHFLELKDNAVGREYSKLRFWGLLEEEPGERQNGNGTGRWRVTPKGEAFIKGRVSVPRCALVFNNQLIGYDDEGDRITIRGALENHFDYDELVGVYREEPLTRPLHVQAGLFGDWS